MKILMVSPVPSHPVNSGNAARIVALRTEMQRQGHEVWFLHSDFAPGDAGAMSAFWGRRYVAHSYVKPWRKFRWFGVPVPDRWHHGLLARGWLHQRVDQLYDFSLDPVARRLHAEQRFDAVIVEYVIFSRVLMSFNRPVLRLIDTHDAYTDRHLRLIEAGLAPEWIFLSRREERRGLRRADRVIAIQEAEASFFRSLLPSGHAVFTVGHFLDELAPLPASSSGQRVVFFGANGTLNQRALTWFIDTVWHKVLARAPGLELHIWGGICDHGFRGPSVVSCGHVREPRQAYEDADIVINPMTMGTGLKIKSIEALSFGRPLVASPVAVEGLPGAPGDLPCIVAGTPDEWVDALSRLSQEENLRAGLATRAVAYIREYVRQQRENLASALGRK